MKLQKHTFSVLTLVNPVQFSTISVQFSEIYFHLKIHTESVKLVFMKVVDIEKLYNSHVLVKTQFCHFRGQKPRGTCPGHARVLGTLGTGFGKN